MATPTRRNFLRAAGVTAAAPSTQAAAQGRPASKAYRQSAFSPGGAPRKITGNLFLFEDTANVYIVKDGSSCVLIDFGSGKVLDHLPALGISKVDWILHTHHHRDQCQGDAKALQRGIPIAVPAHERHLFADAVNFWRNRRVFHLYYVRNDFNTLTENVRVAQSLADYSTFRWKNTDFFVLPTPGHTLGSITLVAAIGGKRVAFSGDLLFAPGKIVNLYDTQINYGGFEGVDLGVYSLARLAEQKPELLCPSHGEPMPDPASAIDSTSRALTAYYHFQTGNQPVEENRPYAISRHLVCHHLTTSTFYALISDSGKALFIDYGSASGVHFGNLERATAATDRIRFVEHSIGRLKSDYGMKSIDVAMPSHMHDDHMNGFPHLKRLYGTRIWCYENMVDVFENPRGYNLGCILGEPFKIDRSFRHGEKFRWEEFEFEVTHSPGHTEYQMAMFVNVDGNRLAFTGDAFFDNNRPSGGAMRHNLIFRNHVENDSHMKSIRNLIEHAPTMICPGHGRAFQVDRHTLEATESRLRRQQQFFFELLPEGETNFALDPSWLRIYPYQILLAPGTKQQLKIEVQNYKPSTMKLEVALVAPAEWAITPDVLRMEVPALGHSTGALDLSVPRSWDAPGQRFAIAADVVRDGRYIGQITEAVVEINA
jgi:glyoxylase-like metal-dependent hydrolase (beta-lactamase superfamily II)